jgi:LysM repeat protein
MSLTRRELLLRWTAPVGFLAGVTILVLLIHAGLTGGSSTPSVSTAPAKKTTPIVRTTPSRTTKRQTVRHAVYYRVQRGDTFGSIAAREGTSVDRLEQLNPGVSSNSLSIGQRLRVK